ncbi:Ubiquitin carboxyl-terminal hydrolase [Carpediemonas membranifera]|uniref:Ubiquitin carboxyl-terminal hydrolase n=1 Tax=Carpediemonas membranifera TaxID=201153 RepID=A0A8J6AWC4_9EUKA|nr:Ubiquitin carboxyl-terminal hydrolase [Carpediemonas membranifera]|eukprot:KAG9393225.1 Ubiquitin carboxyl-terminal hydrolase [Carpediemonas membranifera]
MDHLTKGSCEFGSQLDEWDEYQAMHDETSVLDSPSVARVRQVVDKTKTEGHCGLNNLGNTCYMNSALQCLSNTPLFRKALLNYEPTELEGVTKHLRELLATMWMPGACATTPSSFKQALGALNPRFGGFSQEDSSEMLNFLFEGIHDTFVPKCKDAVPEIDSTLPQEEQVREAWKAHQARGDSLISRLFTGLYKSTVACDFCKAESATYEPFQMLSLPVPRPDTRVTFIIIPMFAEPVTKHGCIRQSSPETIKEALEALNMPFSVNRAVVITSGSFAPRRVPLEKPMMHFGIHSNTATVIVAEVAHEADNLVEITLGGQPWMVRPTLNVQKLKESADELIRMLLDAYGLPDDVNLSELHFRQNNITVTSDTLDPSHHGVTVISLELPRAIRTLVECPRSVNMTPKPEPALTLADCFQAEFDRDMLDGVNMWRCPSCKEPRKASKQLTVARTPPVLIIHLRRFDATSGYGSKVDTLVDFPEHLDLADVMPQLPVDSPSRYTLNAVSHHSGSLSFGHYTASGRGADGKWLYFNDSRVSRASFESARASTAFLLFYSADDE